MMKRLYPFAFVIGLWLLALIIETTAFAGGRIEHSKIASKILATAGEVSERELSVYLPEEYDTSELTYPVVYLIHGAAGNNMSFVRWGIAPIIDKLIEDAKTEPLIVVMTNMSRSGNSRNLTYEDYLSQETVQFVDTKYRTIPSRQARAIAGHSRGGADALYTSLAHPEVFSLVGTYAAGFYRAPPSEDLLKAHDQTLFPLQFWIYVGRNDDFGNLALNRPFVDILIELGLPHVFVVDDGDHSNMVMQRLAESIEFFSRFRSETAASLEPYSELTSVWGGIKHNF